MKFVVIFVASIAFNAQVAWAEWSYTAEGPDVFGNTTFRASTGGRDQALVLECDQKGKLLFGWIRRQPEGEYTPTASADLLVQVDNQKPLKLEAEQRGWNDRYWGIIVDGKSETLIATLQAIAAGRQKINVGAEYTNGKQATATFETVNSRRVISESAKVCKLDVLGRPS